MTIIGDASMVQRVVDLRAAMRLAQEDLTTAQARFRQIMTEAGELHPVKANRDSYLAIRPEFRAAIADTQYAALLVQTYAAELQAELAALEWLADNAHRVIRTDLVPRFTRPQ